MMQNLLAPNRPADRLPPCLDDDGFLLEPERWTPALAEALARDMS